MSSKQRREREKEELRELILKEATQMFLREGYEKTSMRKIAKRVEYSVGTLYLYYKNKDELLYAVQGVAFNHFLNYMKPLMDIQHPVERVKKMGEIYLFFSLQNPDYYDLMFVIDAPMKAVEEGESWKKGEQLFHTLKYAVQDCIDQGYTKIKDVDALSMMLWSTMHGMVTLSHKERLRVMQVENEQIVMNQVNAMMIDSLFQTN
ncbi:MAG: TetR/AcrR family transcriptional regulator [Bacteroidota bacterium]